MKVVIPVAGIGTRLRPHTHSQPKPLLHVAGRTIIDHILESIVKLKPDEVIFVVGFMGDEIEAHIRANYSFSCRFVAQDNLLGLGYALNLALADIDAGRLLVVLGDTIVDADLNAFVSAGPYVLGLRQVDDPGRFGIAEIKDGRIVGLEEKPDRPKSNLAVIGLYYFEDLRTIKAALSQHIQSGKTTKGEIQLTDALEIMIRQGTSFVPFEVRGWYDCGKRETLLETNRHLLEMMKPATAPAGCTIHPPVFVAESARISNSTLGPHVSVAGGASITSAVISNSIIGDDATVEDCRLTDSLIGRRAVVKGARGVLNIGDDSEIRQG
ncbi:MAG: NTP transferase domain-containing protein [candidate division Zixibacteria bacterium]|nr:NTP transferase domain-containing protein [candidate division Zixibacteria bacterium]